MATKLHIVFFSASLFFYRLPTVSFSSCSLHLPHFFIFLSNSSTPSFTIHKPSASPSLPYFCIFLSKSKSLSLSLFKKLSLKPMVPKHSYTLSEDTFNLTYWIGVVNASRGSTTHRGDARALKAAMSSVVVKIWVKNLWCV